MSAPGKGTDTGARPVPAVVRNRALIVDDQPDLLVLYAKALEKHGIETVQAQSGEEASSLIAGGSYDVVVSDLMLPGMDGLALLKMVRQRDLDVPVLLVTGQPTVESAAKAIEYGVLRYLTKPVDLPSFVKTVEEAIRLGRMARLKRRALEFLGTAGMGLGDRAGLEATFERALKGLWMAYQPIVRWPGREVYANEALVRTYEPALANPQDLIQAAERLGRLNDLGRAIRAAVAATLGGFADPPSVFVNLHAADLDDGALYLPSSPLSRFAHKVTLEITERAPLDSLKDVRGRIQALRDMGYRIAIDDLGAGYAGLTSFAQLQPDVVKLDMSLIRNVHSEPTKLQLVRSMVQLCTELKILAVAEGIETPTERDAISEAGCELMQGFLFARPDRALRLKLP